MGTRFLEGLIDDTAGRIARFVGARECWFEPFPFDAQLPRIEPGRIVLPAAEPGVEPWAWNRGVELPVRFNGLTIGRYVLIAGAPTTGVAFSPTARAGAMQMAAVLGAALAAALVDDGFDASCLRATARER